MGDSRFLCMCRVPLRFPPLSFMPPVPYPSRVSGVRVLLLAAQMRPSFSLLPLEGGKKRGGGWPRETVLPHSGKPTPPRFARLPLPEEGARMIFKETLIKSLSFAGRDSRFPTCAAHLSDFLICLSYR